MILTILSLFQSSSTYKQVTVTYSVSWSPKKIECLHWQKWFLNRFFIFCFGTRISFTLYQFTSILCITYAWQSFLDLVLISDVSLSLQYITIQSNSRGFTDFFLMVKLNGFDWVCFLVFAFCFCLFLFLIFSLYFLGRRYWQWVEIYLPLLQLTVSWLTHHPLPKWTHKAMYKANFSYNGP